MKENETNLNVILLIASLAISLVLIYNTLVPKPDISKVDTMIEKLNNSGF